MTIPKYVIDILSRSEMARGIGDPGYTIYIHKATRQTLISTFQKEINRLIAWCNRQVPQMEDCPTAKILQTDAYLENSEHYGEEEEIYAGNALNVPWWIVDMYLDDSDSEGSISVADDTMIIYVKENGGETK